MLQRTLTGSTEWLRLVRNSEGPLIQSPSRATKTKLPWTMSKLLLNISKEGVSKASLGTCATAWSSSQWKKKYFLTLRWSLLCSTLCPLPLVLSLDAAKKSLALFSAHTHTPLPVGISTQDVSAHTGIYTLFDYMTSAPLHVNLYSLDLKKHLVTNPLYFHTNQ